MKKKIERFLTMKRKADDGFTLVELIVVIAILGILAGVGTVGYSGYIKKANMAADQVLLDSLNTAFAAACIENGVDVSTLANGSVAETWSGKSVTAVSAPYNDAFVKYYDVRAEFKVMTDLKFENGRFVDANGQANREVMFNGVSYQISEAVIEAFKGSIFSKDVGAMQGQVSGLAGAFSKVVDAENAASISPQFADYLTACGTTNVGDAAVLYVAQNAGSITTQDAANLFNKAKDVENLNDLLTVLSGEGDALTNMAVMYGAVTAFANNEEYCKDEGKLKDSLKNVKNSADLLLVFDGLKEGGEYRDQWNSYIGVDKGEGITDPSAQFTADYNGFLGAMDAITTVSEGLGELSNGNDDGAVWNSEAVKGLLSQLGVS